MSSCLWAETLFPVVWASMLFHGAPASNIFSMALRHGAHCQEHLRINAPASHKPHLAEKSTPVWLAIWRTWAGFANSQLLPDAAAGAPSRALSAESPVERQLFRTDFRFAPSLPQRFACGPLPFTRTWSSTVCAEELPTPREMPVH